MARLNILSVAGPQPIAPAGIWFEAVDIAGFDVQFEPVPGETYDPSFHKITYIWTVVSAPLGPFDAPENMVPDWNDPNRSYGRQVAFFFPEPGRYEVALWARDASGNEAQATTSILIADANVAYPGTQTVCVSFEPDENWDGAPPGSQFASTPRHLDGIIARAKTPMRVLFKRGQRFSIPGFGVIRRQLGHLDAWGQGSIPVLEPNDGQSPVFELSQRSQITQFTAANLAFRGAWNAATETGYSTRSPLLWDKSPTPCHHTIWNCRFSGFDHLDFEVKRGLTGSVLVGNSHVTNWRNYGFLLRSSNTRFALVGSTVAQASEALHGGPKRGHLWNNHGPVRIADCAKVYIGMSDFFSRTGWSRLAKELADQPCLRLNTNAVRGNAYNLDRIVCEGGFHPVSVDGATDNLEETPGNYLIDKALMIGTAKTIGPFLVAELGGLTVRNMIGVLPDTPRKHPNRWQGVIRTRMDNPSDENARTPVAFYGISAVNLLSADNMFQEPWEFHVGGEEFLDYTLENVVLHEALLGGALDLSQPLVGIRPRFRGIRYGYTPQTGTLAAHIARGQSLTIPYSEITEDQPDRDGTAPTDQAYWAETTNLWHMLWVKGIRKTLYSADGDFTITFDETSVILRNTGRKSWPVGADWMLKLDRRDRLPAMDTRFATTGTVPLPQPVQAQLKSPGGTLPFDDFFGHPRGADPSQGAVEPI